MYRLSNPIRCVFAVSLGACIVAIAFAQQEDAKNSAERKAKFRLLNETINQRLPQADPAYFQQKFVVTLVGRRIHPATWEHDLRKEVKEAFPDCDVREILGRNAPGFLTTTQTGSAQHGGGYGGSPYGMGASPYGGMGGYGGGGGYGGMDSGYGAGYGTSGGGYASESYGGEDGAGGYGRGSTSGEEGSEGDSDRAEQGEAPGEQEAEVDTGSESEYGGDDAKGGAYGASAYGGGGYGGESHGGGRRGRGSGSEDAYGYGDEFGEVGGYGGESAYGAGGYGGGEYGGGYGASYGEGGYGGGYPGAGGYGASYGEGGYGGGYPGAGGYGGGFPDGSGQDNAEYRVSILAPSEEAAKCLGRAFLNVQDRLFAMQVSELKGELANQAKQLAGLESEAKAIQDKVRNTREELRELGEEIGEDTLSDFKTRSRLYQVDMEGIKARFKAADRLADGETSDSLRERLYDIRLTAEIDLADLLAKRQALEEIIDRATELSRRRASLAASESEWKIKSANSQPGLAQKRAEVESLRRQLAQYRPFELKRNTVLIQPLKWKAAAPDSASGASGGGDY